MKKACIYIALLITAGFSACKKDTEDRFYDPDRLTGNVTDVVPGMFTQLVTNNKIFVQDYGEWYYLLNGGTGITGYEQIAQRYVSYRYDWFGNYNDLVSGNGFDDFPISGQAFFENSYTKLKNYETIRDSVYLRSGQLRQDGELYLKLVTLVKLYQSAKLVDLFNSIPYFDAFQGARNGSQYLFPKYDDPKEIYTSIIKDMGNIVDSLPLVYAKISPAAKTVFEQQDVVFKGDISRWTAFANFTRLKLLVRIAGVDEAFARPLIQATLGKPLPTQDLTWTLWYAVDVKSGGTWQRGLYENTYAAFIPDIIMKRLNYGDSAYKQGEDDPRLPVLAMPTKYKDYRGVSANIEAQTKLYDKGERYYAFADNINSSLTTNAKSMYSHVTFHNNVNMPVYMASLGELDLLLAEIALKGLANTGKSAEEHLKDEVRHSVNFWYTINQLSQYKRGTLDSLLYPTKPTDAIINAWADRIKDKFAAAPAVDDKMEILMQQKFIHLNILHPYELWAELRRTRHPKLEPFTWRTSVWKPMPERVHYPTIELTNNPDNFSKVAAQNNTTTPIFWVPVNVRSKNPYWDNYNYE
ncbi:SusD/RagB family nutrient-binding outer membrane lipoprotein [Chitinophaga nivalis]|uniref:SusD/RagB family nutrient-binding outer membrane lipoprotein n=1 Tax=Chitinophaga nivalis TaxID=2991709 RepID=A0ABT3IFG1_9BACT|nr:SusD/RagB family nutrient-binding outer membrane lipoprotein [Chitinophaga nivalis]MCW3467611.1 SusD/RagB family nutrient-binding outer membrane lipoprotein [Chitinophaga nivalis]MCW3482697.1 SusD/RagB family nutrient-binding outer membrane lipoprotein [Chitinophaga nivalis]